MITVYPHIRSYLSFSLDNSMLLPFSEINSIYVFFLRLAHRKSNMRMATISSTSPGRSSLMRELYVARTQRRQRGSQGTTASMPWLGHVPYVCRCMDIRSSVCGKTAARKRPENSSMAVSTILYKSTLMQTKFLHIERPTH